MAKKSKKQIEVEGYLKIPADQRSEVQKAEIRLFKARKHANKIKYQKRQKERKKRDTALYTLGAIFAHFHESTDPKKKAFAERLWKEYYHPVAPALADDRRREALRDIFGLAVSDAIPRRDRTNVDNSASAAGVLPSSNVDNSNSGQGAGHDNIEGT